ncbi:phage tail tip lysozyme [Paraburkholderia tropica]|uniref:phage tail tip lysozyme n=1 Tax=Paraburkholderia tropica TaxID=92647 RepID=UPI002AB26548|nr:phage tail tip lysozyme [Paraburkholderia tropica]
MSEVKINIGAGVQGVEAAISKITASMNKLGATVAKSQGGLKFEDTTTKLMARDLSLLNRQFEQAIKLSAGLRNALKNSGQSGLHISQIDWSKTSADPRIAARFRDRAFSFAVRGTSLDPTLANEVDEQGNAIATAPAPSGGGGGVGSGGGGGTGRRPPRGGDGGRGGDADGKGSTWWTRRPAGGFRSAAAEAIGAGIGGHVGGMITAGLSGGLPGVLLSGLTAAIGGGMEGIDQAKARNIDLDALKRSMGDLGISFEGLSDASYKAAKGLGMANGEFVKMEELANTASGGAYRTPADLGGATREGVDLARAYGVQPGQGVSFVSGMLRLNSRQDNKELAVQIAEAIENAQGKATPGEVMQAMQSFASSQNRFNSGSVDLYRFGNAFGSLLNGDMTADHASSILGQANSAMQQMGGTEPSKNFTLQAFGNLDPVRAGMRAEGGLFGNGLDSPSIGGYMRAHGVRGWDDMARGPSGTNFSIMRGAFDRAYAGRGAYGAEMELDAQKNYFGLKSYADTASFMNMSDSDHSGIATVLKNAGLNLSDVREGGLQALAGISRASSFDDLDSIYKGSIRGRGDMSPADLQALDGAEKTGDFQQFQNELVRVLSGKGQEDTQATTQRSIDATLTDIKTKIGDALLPMTNTIMQGIIKMAGLAPVAAPSTGSGAPYGFATKGGVAQPVAASAARGGTTVGGAGNARDMRGHVDTSGDDAAAYVNNAYGAAQGGWYGSRDDVQGGMAQLMGLGVDKAHAAAIMASAIRESSMKPGARNGNMYGLFQFDKARQADFKRVMGKDIHGSSASEQIAYMVKSMQAGGEEAGPGKEFWASSAKDAASVFARKIERTDHPSKESDIRSGVADSLGDIHITLNQTIAGSSGQSKTKKLTTKVSKPTAQGLDPNPTIIELPA